MSGEAQSTQPAPALPVIIKDLGNNAFATREAAQKELERIPSSEVETLRAAAKGATDDEVRARLEVRIAEMEFDLLMHPKPLSLDVENASLATVVNILNDQLGTEFIQTGSVSGARGAAAEPPGVTLKLQDVPLWEILRRVNEKTPFTVTSMAPLPSPRSSPTSLRLTPVGGAAGGAARPMIVTDGMAVVPQTAGAPATGNWSLRCTVYLDPRLRVTRNAPALRVEKAVDQDGKALSWLPPPAASQSSSSRPMPSFSVTATFAGMPGITAIKELRGTAVVEIVESEKTYTIDLTKDPIDSIQTSAAKVTLERKAGEFRLTLKPPDMRVVSGALSGPGTPSIGILVKDAQGNVLQTTGASGTNITMNIKGNATIAEITTADKSHEVTLPIVLKDVSIPAGGPGGPVPGVGRPAPRPLGAR